MARGRDAFMGMSQIMAAPTMGMSQIMAALLSGGGADD
ncbi:hypothetical protein LTSEBAI_1706 [Salmonella enterica subsp. enterica serovar Baildon str. R6-199]|nr:hypothetical protein LTSEBAI_1706 [Salmonella enterica subsp. enterica serovar Baildon str. R6-199]